MTAFRTNYFLDFKATITLLVLLITYFLYMDVALYYHVQALPPLQSATMASTSSNKPSGSSSSSSVVTSKVVMYPTKDPDAFSPFKGLSIKIMMLDHSNVYIFNFGSAIFNELTHFSERFYFITPNMISFFHLAMAVLAAKLVSSETLLIRQLGVLVFEFRSFLDSLDGTVARARMNQTQNISRFGSFGHFIDGLTDTFGVIALLTGVVCYLKNQSVIKIAYSLLPTWKKAGMDISSSSPNTTAPSVVSAATNRKLVVVISVFGLLQASSALFWERYISGYHDILESQPLTSHQAMLQMDILKSSLMWAIMCFWRLSCAFALVEMLLISILLDKIWEFLTWIQYIGCVVLFTLIFVTEIHYHYAKHYVGPIRHY